MSRAGRELTVMGSGQGAARRRGPWAHPLLLACGVSFLLLPAPAWTDVYTWMDERGVQHFVGDAGDIPERVRGRARLFIVSAGTGKGETAPAPAEVPLASPEGSPASPAPTDQGAFAVSLAERLGLAYLPAPPEAATVLAQRGIVPPGGWLLGGPISPGWLADLARSLLAASSAGLIPHAPGEAFGILEALAAEVGVALVPIEPPLPPRPPVVGVPAQGVIFESIVLPAFRFRHGRFFHHRHFQKRIRIERGERHPHRRPSTVSRRTPAEDASRQFHRLGNGFHRIGTGFHRLGRPQPQPLRGHR
ncbi:MAG: hypothetical protein HYT86_04695 [candidate division NC10 bacterium]|nr:hypothetical protein [candidate division NC10 bacterium]